MARGHAERQEGRSGRVAVVTRVLRRPGIAVLCAALLGGCAGSGPRSAEFQVSPGQYARAFDEARDVLTGYRFELDRVDAAGGVIATAPKTTAGLATPWDSEQTTLEDIIQAAS